MRTSLALVLGTVLSLACSMPNPAFDQRGDELGGTGDGDGEPSTGDGDGDPIPGDGDGDPIPGDGDGDGEPMTSTTGDGDGEPILCEAWEELCNGTCVDGKTDPANCGFCGNVCDDGELCGGGECASKRYVFVSSELFQVNSGLIDYATEKCNQLAGLAGLPGTYRPWLSDNQQSPATTFSQEPGVFVLPGGTVVAYSWADLVDGELEVPITRYESGEAIAESPVEGDCPLDFAVWTATTSAGLYTEPSCVGWSASDNATEGMVGNAKSVTAWSESGCTAPCHLELPVYCVEN